MRRNYNKLYDIYYRKYVEKQLKDVPMQPVYNRKQFKLHYEMVYNTKIEDDAPRVNIIRDVVKGQEDFQQSRKQAQAIQRVLKEKGFKVSVKDIRYNRDKPGIKDFFEDIKNTYNELKEKGVSTIEARKYISNVFYSSP